MRETGVPFIAPADRNRGMREMGMRETGMRETGIGRQEARRRPPYIHASLAARERRSLP